MESVRPRIGIIALFGECNAFRQPIPTERYKWMAYHEGDSLLAAMGDGESFFLPETRGFFADMDAAGPWQPVPLLYAASASGPVLEEDLLSNLLRTLERLLDRAPPLDGVYIAGHGSVIATHTKDVDAALLALLRRRLGPTIPIVETLDPHGKVSVEMIDRADLLVSIRTDPHVDNYERGVEAAQHMRRLLDGMRPCVAYVRLPIMIPTVSMVAASAPFRPAVELGVSRITPEIANVSILPGYPWTDSPDAGLHVVVSGWVPAAVESLAHELAGFIWERREGFAVRLASVDELVTRVQDLASTPALPSLCFADVADNPGGGALGNTMHILEALVTARATGCVVGVIHDPAVAAVAHAAGIGATVDVTFNRDLKDPFSQPYTASARVVALADGRFVARNGVARGVLLDQGPTAALQIDGVTVVVATVCYQTLAVEQLEMVGVRLPSVRAVVVKSRGHYQGSFGEFFTRPQMIEVDAPGWTTPKLSQLPYRNINRPLYPLDPDTRWSGLLTYVKPLRPHGNLGEPHAPSRD